MGIFRSSEEFAEVIRKCQACILCGSGQVEQRKRVVTDFIRMRSAKYECHHCHGILYRKNRIAATLSKWRQSSDSVAQAGH